MGGKVTRKRAERNAMLVGRRTKDEGRRTRGKGRTANSERERKRKDAEANPAWLSVEDGGEALRGGGARERERVRLK